MLILPRVLLTRLYTRAGWRYAKEFYDFDEAQRYARALRGKVLCCVMRSAMFEDRDEAMNDITLPLIDADAHTRAMSRERAMSLCCL